MWASMVGMDPDANAGAQPETTGPPVASVGPDDGLDPDDAIRLQAYAMGLAEGIDAALPRWVERSVARVHEAWVNDGAGRAEDADRVRDMARDAGVRARDEIGPQVRELLARDIDEQRGNPLALVRRAVRFPTAVLRDVGVPPVARDAQAEAHFPDDVYDLTPASFADLDPSLHEPGLLWGAAKAHVHLRRRRAEGQR
jgi:hypothetical protein